MSRSLTDNPSLAAQTVTLAGQSGGPHATPPPAEPAVEAPQPNVRKSGMAAWITEWFLDSETCSWLTSGVLHLMIVLLLSLIFVTQRGKGPDWTFEGTTAEDALADVDLEIETLASVGSESSEPSFAPTAMGSLDLNLGSPTVEVPHPTIASQAVSQADSASTLLPSIGEPLASLGGGLEGRNASNRRAIALAGGGTERSEAAVEAGLRWLAEHQRRDGSWSFYLDAQHCPQCAGKCRNGNLPTLRTTTTAPTGLALLCFLGAGYTQQVGPYQETVRNGLYYLMNRMYVSQGKGHPMGGDLRDVDPLEVEAVIHPQLRKSGDMYSHGIATLALCEAYAMTRDESLGSAAQLAIDFIVYAQNETGGWRYEPLEDPGDLSVSGWQLMALKSGVLGQLTIPRNVWYRASEFLDGLQGENGANYGYMHPESYRAHPAMTAVGLYGRMMIGWPQGHPPLLKGAAMLSSEKPNESNMYFNYYASQVLHHVGGSGWLRWNKRMRDYLVRLQADQGHEEGSWYIDEAWSDRGGRLYTTTLAILTLEVYYRYMPMYQSDFVEIAP